MPVNAGSGKQHIMIGTPLYNNTCLNFFTTFSVYILLYNITRQAFVLVKQFRPGKLTSSIDECMRTCLVNNSNNFLISYSFVYDNKQRTTCKTK